MIDKYIEYLSQEKRYSEHTVKAYGKDLSDFFLYLKDERIEVETIRKKEIRGYIAFLASKNNNKTINRKISAIKGFFKFLKYIGEIEKNPAAGVKSLRTHKPNVIPLTPQEFDALLMRKNFSEGWEGDRDFLLLQMLYETGLRRAELVSLNYQDINFAQKQLKVLGKRSKERIIPLRDELLQSIEKLKKETPYYREDYALFTTSKGKRIYPKLVYNIVISYLRAVTTKKKISPHIIRHSFATAILNKGAEINAVKELLGHSSLASTQIYTHNDIGRLKEVFNKAHPREKN